jgi:dihydrofolate reductase
MPKLVVFNSISLDGYFVDGNGDMRWAHNPARDDAWEAFGTANAQGGGGLVFGRITYELMQSYWPTPAAARNDPGLATHMNALPKIVFSRTLREATWNNTRLVKTDPAAEIRQLKQAPGPDLVILGSGRLVTYLTQAQLIDEYQLVVVPVALGKGRTLFDGLAEKLPLQLTQSRTFGNGNVVLHYARQA